MSALTGLGALLGGITSEAAQVHKERFEQDQANKKMAFDTLTHLIDDPNIGNPAVKEEALQELQSRWMAQLHPDNYSHKPGKLGKLVDEFIGMQSPAKGPLGPLMSGGTQQPSQPGVGSGNSTPTQLGASQPTQGSPLPPPPQGMAQPQPDMQGSAQQPQAQPQAGGPQPPPWLQMSQGDTTPSGFLSPQGQLKLAGMKKWQDSQLQAEQVQEQNKIKLGFDVGQFKKGEVVDARLIPMLDTMIRSTMPEAATETQLTPDGHKVIHLIDKNPRSSTFGKELSTADLGESQEAARGGLTELIKAFQRDHGRPPDQKEALKLVGDYERAQAEAGSGARLPFQETLAAYTQAARTAGIIESGDARQGRTEVAKAFEPLRQGVSRYNIMKQVAERVASGKSGAAGADDMVLLSNHIAMTFGDVTGARTGRDLIEAHLAARDLPSRVKVAAERVLKGEQLSEGQRKEFLGLAKEKLDEMKNSFNRTKLLWGYEPPGNDEFFKLPEIGGPSSSTLAPSTGGGLSASDFKQWLADQVAPPAKK